MEGSDAQENAMFNPSKETFDQSNSPRKGTECDSLDGNNSMVSTSTNSHVKMCKPQ